MGEPRTVVGQIGSTAGGTRPRQPKLPPPRSQRSTRQRTPTWRGHLICRSRGLTHLLVYVDSKWPIHSDGSPAALSERSLHTWHGMDSLHPIASAHRPNLDRRNRRFGGERYLGRLLRYLQTLIEISYPVHVPVRFLKVFLRQLTICLPFFSVFASKGKCGDLVKVMSWYDNEWGCSSQMVREARRIAATIDRPVPDPASAHATS